MIKIRKIKNSEIKEVANLISKVFFDFNSKEGSKEAIKKYIDSFSIDDDNLENLKKRFTKNPFIFVAVDNNKIIGLIRGDLFSIFGLFVLGDYHGQGVGKRLIETFEKELKKNGSKKIRARSSMFAVKFYEKMGYKKSTGLRNFHELKIQPMKKILV